MTNQLCSFEFKRPGYKRGQTFNYSGFNIGFDTVFLMKDMDTGRLTTNVGIDNGLDRLLSVFLLYFPLGCLLTYPLLQTLSRWTVRGMRGLRRLLTP